MIDKRLKDYIDAQEHSVDLKNLVHEYNSVKKFETNSVEDILNEIKEFGYETTALAHNVSLEYLEDTFKPKRQMSTKIYELEEHHKKDIQLMVDSGYRKTFIYEALFYDNNRRIDKQVLVDYINEYKNKKEIRGYKNPIRNDFEW